jgi:hypothetical protein
MIYGARVNQIRETLESNGLVWLWRMDSGVREACQMICRSVYSGAWGGVTL